ncbi:LysR family transcriptional regulator [Caldimonas tepidiphila]|uniref:LysR family transcriptional regulator n=1 Tax=Caldimonas tepidiphila TaxID=2315841 RepID=UPI000E5C295A|nr:LysR family transcriptional regulator [Caldimonas tepidiphila]
MTTPHDTPPASRAETLWAHLHALGVIAQQGSFTKAAQRLGLSKAAVSQRVAELERAVGLPLVQRTTRSVRLTDAGQRLVDSTAASFAQIEQGLLGVRELAGRPRGLVRLTAPVALGRQHVAPHLEEFLRRWPEIRIELDLSDRLVNLAQEGFDLAVRHTSAPPDNHVAWRLCGSRALLVASAGYLRRRGVPRHPSELAAHDCLPYLRGGPAQWMFERGASGEEPERVSVAVGGPLRANNSEVLRDAVLSGLGVALLPDFSAAAALRAGRLRELLPDWRPVGFFGEGVYAMRPWSPQVPRAVQELVAHLRAALAAGFAPAS